ncbi:MAG: peptide protein [Segetibacter sp.]|nr:peptide protein [Segetibacter sp.]
MKTIITFSISLFMLFSAFGQTRQNAADKIIGVYWSPKQDAKIEIYKKGDKYFGKSAWSSTKRKDSKNPNASLRDRELLGVELFTNFVYKGGLYEDGKIYDPESGKTYDCKMSLVGGKLKVRGYIGISLFGRTEIFERII